MFSLFSTLLYICSPHLLFWIVWSQLLWRTLPEHCMVAEPTFSPPMPARASCGGPYSWEQHYPATAECSSTGPPRVLSHPHWFHLFLLFPLPRILYLPLPAWRDVMRQWHPFVALVELHEGLDYRSQLVVCLLILAEYFGSTVHSQGATVTVSLPQRQVFLR